MSYSNEILIKNKKIKKWGPYLLMTLSDEIDENVIYWDAISYKILLL